MSNNNSSAQEVYFAQNRLQQGNRGRNNYISIIIDGAGGGYITPPWLRIFRNINRAEYFWYTPVQSERQANISSNRRTPPSQ